MIKKYRDLKNNITNEQLLPKYCVYSWRKICLESGDERFSQLLNAGLLRGLS